MGDKDMRCDAFNLENPDEIKEHVVFDIIKDYGDFAYGHNLHTWDDGKRLLARCRKCGGYILIQKSEFHGYGSDDSYYTDLFPVEDEEEAEELNRKYDGFSLEMKSGIRFLIADRGSFRWS